MATYGQLGEYIMYLPFYFLEVIFWQINHLKQSNSN